MPAWYGHTITVNVEEGINFPKYGGKFSFLNDIISEETSKLNKKMKFFGSQLTYKIATQSQLQQRRAITELEAVRTGRLRDSIEITGSGLTANIGTDLFYAKTVHDVGYQNQKIFNINGMIIRGHSDIGPRPWTERASAYLLSEIDGIVTSEINETFY